MHQSDVGSLAQLDEITVLDAITGFEAALKEP